MQTSLTRKKKDKAHYDQQNIVSKPDKRVMVHNIIIGIPVSPRLVTKCPSTYAYSLWQRDFISVHLVITTDMQQKCKTNLESLDIQLHTGMY